MRLLALVASLMCFASVSACDPSVAKDPEVLKRLGNPCETGAECGSGECLHGACTRACSSQGDCPWGLDCGLQKPDDAHATCYPALYPQPTVGGFNTSCSLFAGECGASDNPCASGFTCRASYALYPGALPDDPDVYKPVECDPEAICTKGCESDVDCPTTMFCGTDRGDPSDKSDDRKVCLPRTSCTPCATDDQCPFSSFCVLGEDGDRFCAKSCSQPADCLKPEKDQDGDFIFEAFDVCTADRGDGSRTVCQPAGGRCFGKSVIATQPDGGVCSPCRQNHPEDCAQSQGCIESPQGEWFCTDNCSVKLTRSGNGYSLSADTCPDGTYCYTGGYVPQDCGNECLVKTICTADPQGVGLTCMPRL